MNRRTFVGAVTGGLLVAPLGGLAQPPAKVPRIGVTGERSASEPFVGALRSGLVVSLARPGGNATGMSSLHPELGGKQLELLKAIAPRIARVTVVYNPVSPTWEPFFVGVREAARALAVEVQFVEARHPNEIASALSALTPQRTDALLVLSDPVFGSHLAQISQFAAKNRLPALYARREFAEARGLLAYGPSFEDNFRRAATYVDKILEGAKPSELPVQQPTRLELVINRRRPPPPDSRSRNRCCCVRTR